MTKIPALHQTLRGWLLEGPLSAQVPAYVARLRRGRYATHTCDRYVNAVAHFAHWMSMCHLPARMLNEGCIDQFLRYHLPRCDCLGGALRTPRTAQSLTSSFWTSVSGRSITPSSSARSARKRARRASEKT